MPAIVRRPRSRRLVECLARALLVPAVLVPVLLAVAASSADGGETEQEIRDRAGGHVKQAYEALGRYDARAAVESLTAALGLLKKLGSGEHMEIEVEAGGSGGGGGAIPEEDPSLQQIAFILEATMASLAGDAGGMQGSAIQAFGPDYERELALAEELRELKDEAEEIRDDQEDVAAAIGEFAARAAGAEAGGEEARGEQAGGGEAGEAQGGGAQGGEGQAGGEQAGGGQAGGEQAGGGQAGGEQAGGGQAGGEETGGGQAGGEQTGGGQAGGEETGGGQAGGEQAGGGESGSGGGTSSGAAGGGEAAAGRGEGDGEGEGNAGGEADAVAGRQDGVADRAAEMADRIRRIGGEDAGARDIAGDFLAAAARARDAAGAARSGDLARAERSAKAAGGKLDEAVKGLSGLSRGQAERLVDAVLADLKRIEGDLGEVQRKTDEAARSAASGDGGGREARGEGPARGEGDTGTDGVGGGEGEARAGADEKAAGGRGAAAGGAEAEGPDGEGTDGRPDASTVRDLKGLAPRQDELRRRMEAVERDLGALRKWAEGGASAEGGARDETRKALTAAHNIARRERASRKMADAVVAFSRFDAAGAAQAQRAAGRSVGKMLGKVREAYGSMASDPLSERRAAVMEARQVEGKLAGILGRSADEGSGQGEGEGGEGREAREGREGREGRQAEDGGRAGLRRAEGASAPQAGREGEAGGGAGRGAFDGTVVTGGRPSARQRRIMGEDAARRIGRLVRRVRSREFKVPANDIADLAEVGRIPAREFGTVAATDDRVVKRVLGSVGRVRDRLEAEYRAALDAKRLFQAQREECPPRYRPLVNKYFEVLGEVTQ